jgi:hypothetical protein
MPLPSPWKTPSTPPSPSSIRRKTSLRHRKKARIGFLVLIGILTIIALNELRCMHYSCVSRFGFYGAGIDRAGGATLPDDWKYRLGEQLKMNMEAMPPPPPPPDRKENEETEQNNGALVEPLTISPAINPGVQDPGNGGRWIDAPSGPAAQDTQTKEQIKTDKQTHVDGNGIEAQEASEHPAAALPSPSPGVPVAAEDLRAATAAGVPSGTEKQGAGGEDAAPQPPKVDKTKEKVDGVIALKTLPMASQGADKASASAPRPSAKNTPDKPAAPALKSQHHTHDVLAPPQLPQSPAHGLGDSNFGSMDMGLLVAGG